ncbi:helix-turn-helix transcriptional regulator [Streptomyces sp. DSM 41524]|uniref:Helix-turn-helix transcriptional regulator n=1 Tax=Streptomyces asiaticus subsp. ignotus TaxID=3098222 RepID=A0ABU7QCC5_9ACTN|nr:helix-turn-helix transcriptional regulator [Streptomyces sp. DSM 41524]
MPYRLRTDRLRAVARQKGDKTGYAIAQRTGLAESTISRLLRGKTQPGAKALLRICTVYGATTEDLMEFLEPAA